ncbi:MAG: hydroxypyruvate isomerase family protein [Vicinamibacterales bacterium]|jgi:hydroxypyruvate isomerase
MNRRELIQTAVFAGAGLALDGMRSSAVAAPTPFRLKYGPHFGMFKHHAGEDLVEQLKFAADQGFTAWEDNGMAGRPVELQERIAQAMARLGITMGVFVAMADFQNVTFASAKPEAAADIVAKAKAAVDVAKRVNAKWTTVVPGRHDVGLEWDYQTANVIDNLKRCVEVFEPAGIVMVLEPLNPWKDHPGLFLTKIPQAYQICRSIGSPACKILFDMYHQQITEGNIIPNIDRAWSEVAYMQIGDNPGRKEPTTGEMNYRNIFRHIHGKGFTGVLGMEHGNAKPGVEGEKSLIEAYRSCDSW